jgi:Transposase DDE domain group 1
LRQSVFGRLAGYEDVNDADRLCRDPAMRWVVGDRAITGYGASASQMGRFETKWLCLSENLAALADLPGQWIDKVHERRAPKMIVLDMDPSESRKRWGGRPRRHRCAKVEVSLNRYEGASYGEGYHHRGRPGEARVSGTRRRR